MLDVPELADGRTPAAAAIRSIRSHGAPSYGPAESAHRQRQARIEQDIAELKKKYRFTLLDPARSLCSAAGCMVAREGRTLYRDKHHLTDDGAIACRDVFQPLFNP